MLPLSSSRWARTAAAWQRSGEVRAQGAQAPSMQCNSVTIEVADRCMMAPPTTKYEPHTVHTCKRIRVTCLPENFGLAGSECEVVRELDISSRGERAEFEVHVDREVSGSSTPPWKTSIFYCLLLFPPAQFTANSSSPPHAKRSQDGH